MMANLVGYLGGAHASAHASARAGDSAAGNLAICPHLGSALLRC
jgi:hypothetical protein